jgi:hypothetical protein
MHSEQKNWRIQIYKASSIIPLFSSKKRSSLKKRSLASSGKEESPQY